MVQPYESYAADFDATCKWQAMAKIKHSKISYINHNKNGEQAQIIQGYS